jgi:hypothetical protein
VPVLRTMLLGCNQQEGDPGVVPHGFRQIGGIGYARALHRCLDSLIQLLARRMPVLLFLHRCSNSPTAAPAFNRATKSVTCFGSRRGAGVLGEQNARVAMAVNMH